MAHCMVPYQGSWQIEAVLLAQQVVAGQTAALALKRVKRSAVRKVHSLKTCSLARLAPWPIRPPMPSRVADARGCDVRALVQCRCPGDAAVQRVAAVPGAWLQGMVLVDAALQPRATWEFDADIAILTHSTTIAPKYQAVIHCEIVRQAAR